MEAEEVLQGQTVIITGDRISAIGPSNETEVPDGAELIDGRNGYLMPGLADMHIHMAGFNSNPDHLVLYLAEGTLQSDRCRKRRRCMIGVIG